MRQEVLLSTSSANNSSILLHDLHTSNHLQSFRDCITSKNGLTMSTDSSIVMAAQMDKGFLHIYQLGKEAIHLKMLLPERIRCVKISPSGTWCAAGSESGKLFLWEVSNGDLLFVREAHYQPLTQLLFTSDEGFLFTGGEDAVVHVWRMLDLVDINLRSDESTPVQSWNEHTLPITGIICTTGSSMTARLYTSSLDQTIKISDLSTLSLLSTIVFPRPVTCFAIDPAERALYIGQSDSTILQFNLIQFSRGQYKSVLENDPSHPLTTTDSTKLAFTGHEAEITAITLSFDGSLLVSGDKNGEINIWDTASRQPLRKLKGHKGPITNLVSFVKSGQVGTNVQLAQFKRFQRERGILEHTISMSIPDNQVVTKGLSDEEIVKRDLVLLSDEGSEASLKDRVMELEGELKRVYAAYGDLKGLHEKLWNKYVKEKVTQG